MPTIEPTAVAGVQIVHPRRRVRLRRPEQCLPASEYSRDLTRCQEGTHYDGLERSEPAALSIDYTICGRLSPVV